MAQLAHIPAATFSAWLPALFDTAIKGGLLLAVVGLIAFAMRRASAATLHLLWMAALVGLVLLPALALVVPSWRVLPSWMDASAMMRIDNEVEHRLVDGPVSDMPSVDGLSHVQKSLDLHNKESAGIKVAQDATAGAISTAGNGRPISEAEGDSPSSPFRWIPVFGVVWVFGAMLLGCRILLSAFGLWRLARGAVQLTNRRPVEMLQSLSKQLGIHRHTQLYSGNQRDMPIVWGILKSKILLPQNWVTWNDPRLRTVLLHELAHIRRYDAPTQLIAQLACALHWFNPLVWFAASRVRTEREHACDDLVLNHGVKASDYAEHLLCIATNCNPPDLANASVFAMARRFELEERIMRILNENLTRSALSRRMIVASVVLIVSLTVPLAMMQAIAMPHATERAARVEGGTKVNEGSAAKSDGQIKAWIAQLGSDETAVREEAAKALTKAGRKAVPELIEAIGSKDEEIKQRVTGILFDKLAVSDDEATADAVRNLAEMLLKSKEAQRVVFGRKLLDRARNHRYRQAKRVFQNLGAICRGTGDTTDWIILHKKAIKDEHMANLKWLPDLTTVTLGHTSVTDKGLHYLKGLDKITWLDLRDTNHTDAGLKHLVGLTDLRTLYLNGSRVTDVGLKNLKDVTSLSGLYLQGTKVTDAGLKHLKELRRLDGLSLKGANVTDAGIMHLKELSGLRYLFVGGTKITRDGIKKIKQALPECEIRW